MKREITFIHAADLHLDSPFKGLSDMPPELFGEMKNSTFEALHHLVDAAIEHQVDFVLLVGDLFDNERQSLKAQIRLRNAFERLQEHGIPVYMSYGNHDFLKGNVHRVTYPDNVHIFPDETVQSFFYGKNGKPMAKIYGFSYVERSVTENKTGEFSIEDDDVPFHIAMLHGSVQGNADHAPYAPFNLSDLLRKDFDYWALGHIHKRQVLKTDPYIVYPGNTQGRHRKETGEKGCYLVQMTDSGTDISFIPLHSIEFTALTVDVSDVDDVFQLEKELVVAGGKLASSTPQLLDVTLNSSLEKLTDWRTDGKLADMIAIINETLTNQTPWQYIFHTSVQAEKKLTSAETAYGEHFPGELNKTFAETAGVEHLHELFRHRQARKFLEVPEEEEMMEWKEEARRRLFDQLLRGGNR